MRVASIYSIGLSEMTRLREEFARVCPGAQLHIELLRPDKFTRRFWRTKRISGLSVIPEHRRD